MDRVHKLIFTFNVVSNKHLILFSKLNNFFNCILREIEFENIQAISLMTQYNCV